MMMNKPSMGSKSMPPPSSPMDMMGSDSDDDEDMEGEDSNKSSRLLAMQNILDGIGELAGDEMQPYIEQAKQSLHLAHEQEEGDQMGVDQEKEHEMDMSGEPKSGLDVTIGMGGKPPMPDEDEEDEDNPKKGGFLAILSKRMKNK